MYIYMYECVCSGGLVVKKRGPALLEVVTSLCVCSIHPRIKAPRVRARACVNVSEYLCVFFFVGEKRADFRALGIKRQRSSSSLPILHIYSISGEEKNPGVFRALRR